MSARMRIGWCVVALLAWGPGLGTGAKADSISGGNPIPGGVSAANLTTLLPSWKNSARPNAPPAYSPPPPPVIPSPPAVVALPPPDAYSSPAPTPVVTPPAPAPAPAPVTPAPDPSTVPAPVTPAVPGGPVYILPAGFTPDVPLPTAAAAPTAVAPAPAPTPAYVPPTGPDPAASAPASAPAPVGHAQAANAFINMGSGPYPEAGLITTGNAQAWYNSPQIGGLFGGQPDARQQADFTAAVLQRVQQTFQNSGVSVALTTDPGVAAAHTLSLVSNTSAAILPTAIGMTDIGAHGFSFIDQEAKSASTVDQLEWIVAHNIAHELMLAFGVGEHYDTSGGFIDARNATLSMMLDAKAVFSPAAADALNQALASGGSASGTSAQVLGAQTVAEPCTLAVWVFAATALALRPRRPAKA